MRALSAITIKKEIQSDKRKGHGKTESVHQERETQN